MPEGEEEMKQNEYALRMAIRWRKLYGPRNRTKMSLDDRMNAWAQLKVFMEEKKHKGKANDQNASVAHGNAP